MKRWDGAKERDYPEVDAFLDEVLAVCAKHGISISHEDGHGGFIIDEASIGNEEWLNAAAVSPELAKSLRRKKVSPTRP